LYFSSTIDPFPISVLHYPTDGQNVIISPILARHLIKNHNEEIFMKKIISTVLFVFAIAFSSTSIFADSIVAAYTCELKEGKKQEELQALNGKWLKWVRANVTENVESSVGTAVVGKQNMFLFVDTYPDLSTWAEVQTALDSDAAKELENLFEGVSDCSENRLWKFVPTK